MTKNSQNEALCLLRIDSLHFFVRDLPRSVQHYKERLGFRETGQSGAAWEGHYRTRAVQLDAGDVRFVFATPLAASSDAGRFLAVHPEGVGRVVLEVENAERAFHALRERGATCVTRLVEQELERGSARFFDVATPFGGTLFRFIEYLSTERFTPLLVGSEGEDAADNPFQIGGIDHITSNFLTLQPALTWLSEVLGFTRYWGIEFHTQDLLDDEAGGSGLRSVVMWDARSGIKFANNEPAAPHFHASQIYQFCEQHRGAGVQHVALSLSDIVAGVRGMRARGAEFMPTPQAYYRKLPARMKQAGIRIEEELSQLAEHGILLDGAGNAEYLLQIFMREAAALFEDDGAGPCFIELIERKGDVGFGAGNFRALFESIEREQKPRVA